MTQRKADFWWRLLRPHSLTATFIPFMLGVALVWTRTGTLGSRPWLLAAMLAASLLIQIATNLFNEYYDYARGLDTAASVGIGGTIVRDGASPRFVLTLALLCYAVAGTLGIGICAATSWLLIPVGGVFMLIGYLYTGGPLPIAATPFGEPIAGLSMGTGIAAITSFVLSGKVPWSVIVVSLPVAAHIAQILTANNIRDRVADQAHGRHTLVILLGHKHAVWYLAGVFVATHIFVIGLVLSGIIGVWSLLCVAALLPAWNATRAFRRDGQTPAEMMPAMRAVAQTNSIFGLLYILGILL